MGALVDDNSIELTGYSEMVAAELTRIGYPVTDSDSTEIFVDMNIIRGMQVRPPKRSPRESLSRHVATQEHPQRSRAEAGDE